jgi:hypothetical protein
LTRPATTLPALLSNPFKRPPRELHIVATPHRSALWLYSRGAKPLK